jgi:transcriptional regulator with XRE-family HTH domain
VNIRDAQARGRARFADALRASMKARGISTNQLAKAIGTSGSAVHQTMRGAHLPTLRTANRLAEALADPELFSLMVTIRTIECAICRRTFVAEARRIYCTVECRLLAAKGVSVTPAADQRQLAIEAFCRECEPEGACRDGSCVLRAFSPLPLVPLETVRLAERAVRWTADRRWRQGERSREYWSQPANRAAQSIAIRAGMTPEVRAKISASCRRRRAAA